MHPRRTIAFGSAAVMVCLLLPFPLSADEAEDLLGPEALSPAVRAIIDESYQDRSPEKIAGERFNMPNQMEGQSASSDEGSLPALNMGKLLVGGSAGSSAAAERTASQVNFGSSSAFSSSTSSKLSENANQSTVANAVQNAIARATPDVGARISAANIENRIASQLAKVTETTDLSKILPSSDSFSPAGRIKLARQSVENALKSAGLNPNDSDLSGALATLDPNVQAKADAVQASVLSQVRKSVV